MTRTEIKSLLQAAATATHGQDEQESAGASQWTPDGVETLDFEDPRSVDSGGSCTMYGDSGVVRLEIYLPPHRAAEVIEYVVRGERLSPVRPADVCADGYESEVWSPLQEQYTVDVLATPATLHTSEYVSTGRTTSTQPNVGKVYGPTAQVYVGLAEPIAFQKEIETALGSTDGSPLSLELADLIAAQTADLAQGPVWTDQDEAAQREADATHTAYSAE